MGDGQTDFWHSGSTSTTTNNRQEKGTYRDELQESGDYQRTGEGTFTLVDTIESDNGPLGNGHTWWIKENGAVTYYDRTDYKTDKTETTTTKGSYAGDRLTQTKSKTETDTTKNRKDLHYQYGLDDGGTGWAKDHWRLENVTTTAPNEETGLIETTARKTEQIYGTKSDTNASLPPSFGAGPHPNQKFTTLVPFEHTDPNEKVSLINTANGELLDEFEQTITIDPLNDPPPTRPKMTYEELVAAGITVPANGDSWWWAGTKAGAGSVWGNVKLWDNSDVADTYSLMREQGDGVFSSAYAAFGGSLGENIGVGTITSAWDGRNAAGERLSGGQRALYAVGGLFELGSNALGAKGTASGVKQGFKNAKDFVAGGVQRTASRGMDEAAEIAARQQPNLSRLDNSLDELDDAARQSDNASGGVADEFALPVAPGSQGKFVRPDIDPVCFVAGTPVMKHGSPSSELVATINDEDASSQSHSLLVVSAATIAVGGWGIGYSLKRRKKDGNEKITDPVR